MSEVTIIQDKCGRQICAMHFPYRKKICLAIYDKHTNAYIKVATFNSDETAEDFMEYLARFIGAKIGE